MDSDLPKISVVTVNFNHSAYLRNYIDSLRSSTYPIDEIIIVDNCSTDESLQILQSEPGITLLSNKSNIGYSAALNQAIEHAHTSLVCATGPDIVCNPDWLGLLVGQYLKDPIQTFAVASHVLDFSGIEVQSAGGSLHFSGHLCVYGMWQKKDKFLKSELPIEVGAIDSTSVLFDKKKYTDIGGCDIDFFVYHEEFDYCYRARMRGWKCWYHPNSIVYHGDGSQEFSVRSSGNYPSFRPFLHTRNRILSVLKNYQYRTIFATLPVLLVLEIINFLIFAKMGLLKSYIDAIRWVWGNHQMIWKKRIAIQSSRIKGDVYILSADNLSITPVIISNSLLQFIKSALDSVLRIYWYVISKVLYK